MPNFIYPNTVQEGALTAEQVHLLLSHPELIAKRLADLTQMRFISDFLLSGRYTATGGGIFYETGEQIFASDSAEAIAPGAEYPMTVITAGEIQAAKTVKWGRATSLTDELIAQEGAGALNKRVLRLSNTIIADVDAVSMSAITSKVTSSEKSEAWTSGGAIVEVLGRVAAARAELGTGIDLQTIVLNAAQHAKVMGMLLNAGLLSRENDNPVKTGMPVDVLGYTWATTPWYKGSDPLFVDRENLGGMADQKGISPDYSSATGSNIEVRVIRKDSDKYDIQARRITVPVVMEPQAGVKITGTGL